MEELIRNSCRYIYIILIHSRVGIPLIGIKIDFVLMFFPRKSHLFRSGGKIEERRFDQGGD